ncbi:MAG: hypothetical protein EPO21_21230 [Chloroflexota bacterium]|nr:MAG: hypothetical protein EPO21_21230 [Chloroflexota bacterium]
MQQVDTLIKNGYVITIDGQRRVFTDGFVAITAGRITAVGSMSDCNYTATEVIDAKGKAVLPGMTNAHNHLVQVCFRGYNDERWPVQGDLVEAVKRVAERHYAMAARIDEERGYLLGRQHMIELIKAGYTATHDEHFMNTRKDTVDGIWAAVKEAGIRGFLARCPVDGSMVPPEGKERAEEGLIEVERLRAKFNSPLVEVVPGIINYAWITDQEDMRRLKQGAERFGCHFDIDMSDNSLGARLIERGFHGGQVAYYQQFDILNEPIYIGKAHGMRPEEFPVLAKADARVALVPVVRFFDGLGLPVHHLLGNGMLPGIGTDAPLIADSQTPWRAMKDVLLAGNMAVRREMEAGQEAPADKSLPRTETVVEMATIGGARTLFMDHEAGSLEMGKSADCIIVNLDYPTLRPTYGGRRLLANLVWGGEGQLVDTVFVAGRKLLEGGRCTIWDEAEVASAAEQVTRDIAHESGVGELMASRVPGQQFRGWTYY